MSEAPPKEATYRLRSILVIIAALFIAGWFVYNVRWSLRAEFTHDDLMNCHRAVFYPLLRLIGDIVLFVRPSPLYRPLPQLVYRIFFNRWGFDLFPLRLFLMLVMAANVVLAAWFAWKLTGSGETGILTALLTSHHANLWANYFNTGQIYDVFCYFFYFLTLTFYLSIRSKGRYLTWPQSVIFLCLYGLALDCKELAVSLPAVLFAFECLHNPHGFRPPGLLRWVGLNLRPVLAGGLITAAYILGRVMNQEGIGATAGYAMQVSLGKYLSTAGHYLGELFYTGWFRMPSRVAVFALLLLLVAALFRSKPILVGWVLYFVGILPLAFIFPRVLASVWIPTTGLVVVGAYLLTQLRKAFLRRLGAITPQLASQVGWFILAALFVVKVHPSPRPFLAMYQPEYASIRNLRSALVECCPSVPRKARMLFIRDPLNQTYSTVFLVQLLYRDDTSYVAQLFRFTQPPSPAEIASFDYVFDFVDGKLVRLDPLAYAKQVAASQAAR